MLLKLLSKSAANTRFARNLKGASTSTRQANCEAAMIGRIEKVTIGNQRVDSFVRDASVSMNTALRQRTALAFEEAGILNARGELTAKAIEESTYVPLAANEIKNEKVKRILQRDGSVLSDWGKYKTPSVRLPSGETRQIHFYRNSRTGKIDYETVDFKVEDPVSLGKGLK